ncbi:RagB/SusD family nutrient uptake outer membrane protein, partial [Acinetobacter baumannii]
GDRRKTVWVSSKAYSGNLHYYPYKFTTGAAGSSEWPTALRLSEQYLIRAEAKAMTNDWAGAIADVNLLRLKHGALATPLPTPVSQA